MSRALPLHFTVSPSRLAAIRTALASLLAYKAAAQHRETRRQAATVLLLLWLRGRRLLVLRLTLRGTVVHLLLWGRRAVLHLALRLSVAAK
jgi:hypothetical protein